MTLGRRSGPVVCVCVCVCVCDPVCFFFLDFHYHQQEHVSENSQLESYIFYYKKVKEI